jgi:hypothetical protein
MTEAAAPDGLGPPNPSTPEKPEVRVIDGLPPNPSPDPDDPPNASADRPAEDRFDPSNLSRDEILRLGRRRSNENARALTTG